MKTTGAAVVKMSLRQSVTESTAAVLQSAGGQQTDRKRRTRPAPLFIQTFWSSNEPPKQEAGKTTSSCCADVNPLAQGIKSCREGGWKGRREGGQEKHLVIIVLRNVPENIQRERLHKSLLYI